MEVKTENYSSDFKTKVVLEYIKADKDPVLEDQLCQHYDLTTDQVISWQNEFLNQYGNQIYNMESEIRPRKEEAIQ